MIRINAVPRGVRKFQRVAAFEIFAREFVRRVYATARYLSRMPYHHGEAEADKGATFFISQRSRDRGFRGAPPVPSPP